MALPCKQTCPRYCEGCHKTCAEWKQYRQILTERNRRIKKYLDESREQCRVIVSQCAYPTAHRR